MLTLDLHFLKLSVVRLEEFGADKFNLFELLFIFLHKRVPLSYHLVHIVVDEVLQLLSLLVQKF